MCRSSRSLWIVLLAAGCLFAGILSGCGGSGNAAVTPAVSLGPASLDFGSQLLNTTSDAQNVTLSNAGDEALNIANITLTGSSATEFILTNNCGASLASSASCSFSVAFGPRSVGAKSAAVRIVTNAASSPDSLPLTGTGTEPPPDPTIVTTQSGQVRGVMEGDLIAFRGIPFAAPPVGGLRWKPPAAPASWTGVRDASAFGNICPQLSTSFPPQFQGDEDCLTLNVFRTNASPATKQPVMVSIHGGANRFGNGQLAPSGLVARGVIVVTMQYRLGLLGFLAHPLLTVEGNGSSGDYALMDQIAALQWVQRNIAAFGGDPSRILISGGSSGAIDVQALLVSPAAQGLFTRAEMSSEGLRESDVLSLDDSAAYYQRYVQSLGCDNDADVLACLRAKTAEEIVNALQIPLQSGLSTDRITLRLTLERNVLPVDPFQVLRQNGSPVPLLIGSNREDNLVIEEAGGPLPASDADYLYRLHRQFDPVDLTAADRAHSFYPPSDYNNSFLWALVAVHSDYYVTCKERQVALAASGPQRQAVWRYLFTHALENPPPNSNWAYTKAFHGLQYLFLLTDLQYSPSGPTAAEFQLADQMRGYWARFAATGDPNGDGAVEWLRYDSQNEPILQLDDTIQGINVYHKDQCDYFASLPPPPL